jgi:hypothetical protein
MSHFLTLVILPKDTLMAKVRSKVADMLQPHDETISVAPYERECFCIGLGAVKDAEVAVKESFDISQLRKEYHNLPDDERTDEKWQEMIAPVQELRQKLIDAHPLKDKPAPDCPICAGVGKKTSQYNPASKWDTWCIGGRWDGWIYGPERERQCADEVAGFNIGPAHQKLENNCRRVSQIPVDDPYYVPFAILTPEGEWLEQGKMGFWAIVHDPIDHNEWQSTFKAVMSKYAEHLAVAVDCHI